MKRLIDNDRTAQIMSIRVSFWPVTSPRLHMQNRHIQTPEHITQLRPFCHEARTQLYNTEPHWKTTLCGTKHDLQKAAQFIRTINIDV